MVSYCSFLDYKDLKISASPSWFDDTANIVQNGKSRSVWLKQPKGSENWLQRNKTCQFIIITKASYN